MKFFFLLERGLPTEALGVEFVGLPGCFSAGDTEQEALKNAADALDMHIQELLEIGEKIPEQKSKEEYEKEYAEQLQGAAYTLHEIEYAL